MLQFLRAHTKADKRAGYCTVSCTIAVCEARMLTLPRVPPFLPNMPPVMLSVISPVGDGMLELLIVTVLEPRQLGKEKPAHWK